jgi:hypothetical protein
MLHRRCADTMEDKIVLCIQKNRNGVRSTWRKVKAVGEFQHLVDSVSCEYPCW